MIRFAQIIVPVFVFCVVHSASAALPIQIYFSPKGGCTAAVVGALRGATNSVQVQAYSFTSAPIAQALVEASRRGVKVTAILDKSQRSERYSSADFLKNSGIPTLIDDRHAIAHNKIMIIDGGLLLTGSFNFTNAAEESNAENLLLIRDIDLARTYQKNWNNHLAHSKTYISKSEKSVKPKSTKRKSSGSPRSRTQ
jgi:phosphatidylserine/phosphatidylglycerophosphate/cardiolipin synthase-like enzyme